MKGFALACFGIILTGIIAMPLMCVHNLAQGLCWLSASPIWIRKLAIIISAGKPSSRKSIEESFWLTYDFLNRHDSCIQSHGMKLCSTASSLISKNSK